MRARLSSPSWSDQSVVKLNCLVTVAREHDTIIKDLNEEQEMQFEIDNNKTNR